MKDLQNRIQQMLKERKSHFRAIALITALSMLIMIIVPYACVLPGVAMTMNNITSNSVPLVKEVSTSDQIEKAIDSENKIPDAVDFKNNISDLKFVNGSNPESQTIDGGSGSSTSVRMHLYYDNMTGVTSTQRYIYYKLDEKIHIESAFEGDKPIRDSEWTSQKGMSNDQIAAYYSIATNGFIAIKFTQDYISDVIKNGSFKGSLYFDGTIYRDDSASGDQTININGHKLTVQFDDMLKENSKQSIIKEDDSGNMVIHYTVTIQNPGKSTTLSNYKLVDDKLTSPDNIITNPDSIGTLNGNAFEFSQTPDAETIIVEYDYYPTESDLSSLTVNNTATLINKNPDKSDDKCEASKTTTISADAIKADVSKTGSAAYETDENNLGTINWEFTVERPYNLSLKDYKLQDDAFKLMTENSTTAGNLKILNVKTDSYLTQGNDYDLNTSTGELTFKTDVCSVKVSYDTYVDNNGNTLHTEGATNNGVTVKNDVYVYPPNSNTPDDSSTVNVNYSENSSVQKSTADNSQLSILPYENKPDGNTYELKWNVTLTDFGGFADKTYFDTLENATYTERNSSTGKEDTFTVNQYLTDEQIDAISISDLTKDTDYEVSREGTGFKIVFKDTENVHNHSKTLTFSYSSMINADELQNGKSVSVKNKGTYEGITSESEYTVGRQNYQNPQTYGFNAYKNWEGDSGIHPDATIYIQQRAEDSDEWVNFRELKAADLNNGQNWQQDIPKNSVATIEHPESVKYYYRLYEPNVPEGYEAVYDLTGEALENGSCERESYSITNKYVKTDISVNKIWQWDKTESSDSTVRPDTVTFILWRKIESDTDWTQVKKETVAVSKSGTTTSHLFAHLDKTDTDGNKYYYKVTEKDVTDYSTTYSNQPDNGFSSDTGGTVTITNTYDKMVINAEKHWLDDDGFESNRPSITVHLESSQNPSDENSWKTVSSTNTPYIPGVDKITASQQLTASDNWHCSWSNLPRKDQSGKAIYYRVREDTVDENYTVDYYQYVDNTGYDHDYVITNIWKYVSITPQKNWIGDTDATRSEVTVKLQYRHKNSNNQWVENDWTDVDWYASEWNSIEGGGNKTIAKGATTGSPWQRLPKSDTNGTLYYRAVEESVPDGYLETYDENGLNSTGNSVITNTLNTISITPEKIWSGDKGYENSRDTVTFKLQQSIDKINWTDVAGKENISIAKRDGDTWTASDSWTNLPKTDSSRNPIYYQIVEISPSDDYTPSVSTNRNDSGTVSITNVYNYISISATKIWSNDSSGNRKNVTVHLEQSTGTKWENVEGSEQTIEIDSSQNSQSLYTWTKLPRMSGTTEIKYKVVETPINGYRTSVEPETISGQSGSVNITNTKLVDITKTSLKPEANDNNNGSSQIKNPSDEQDSILASELSSVTTKTINGEEYYLFKWKVTIGNGNKVVLTDTLPEDTIYYRTSSAEWGYRLAIYYTSEQAYELRNDEIDRIVEYPLDNDSRKVKFDFSNIGNAEYFTYFTATKKTVVDEAVGADNNLELVNTVVHSGTESGDSATFTIGEKSESPTDSSAILKNYVDKSSNAEFVRSQYQIYINSDAVDLSSEDMLDVTDIFEVIGYQAPNSSAMDERSGLVDAVLSDVSVVDMNDLDSEGNPKEVEYSYTIEKKTETTITKNYEWDSSSSSERWKEWITPCKSGDGDEMLITLKFPIGSTIKASDIQIIFQDQYENHVESGKTAADYINSEYLTLDNSNGSCSFVIQIPQSDSLAKLYIGGQGSFLNIEDITAICQETHVNNYIHFLVPDGKYLRISYYYNLKTNADTPGETSIGTKPPVGATIKFNNKASVETSGGTKTDDDNAGEFEVVDSYGDVTANKPPSIQKINIGNQTINNLSATFKLAKWDGTNSRWIYAASFTPNGTSGDTISYEKDGSYLHEGQYGIIPTGAADLEITQSHPMNLEQNVLYKLVETKSPDGYVKCPYTEQMSVYNDSMKDFVFYFVYNGTPSSFTGIEHVDTSKIDVVQSKGTLSVKNVANININVTKSWTPMPDSNIESTFTLYYSTTHSSTIPPMADLTLASTIDNNIVPQKLNSNNSGSASWTGLPNGVNGEAIYYYVVETSYTVDGKTYYRQNDGSYQTDESNPKIGEYQGIYSNNGLNKDGTVTCTNSKGLSVKKTWKNADNSVMNNPPISKITFTLQGQKSDGTWENINLTEAESTIFGNNTVTIGSEKLQGYKDFQVIENTSGVPYGYIVSYTKNLSGSTGLIEISNKNSQVSKTDFVVKKEWNDGLSIHDGITVTLYKSEKAWADSEAPTQEELNSSNNLGNKQLDANNNWTVSWNELDNLQQDGTRYYYYAVEVVPTGYTAKYERSGTTAVQVETITNTPQENPGSLKVQKVWDKVASGDRKNIQVQLYRRIRAKTTEKYNIPNSISIMCYGDSITLGALNSESGGTITYTSELEKLLSANAQSVSLTNNSFNGRLIENIQDVSGAAGKDVICLLIGTNNVHKNPPDIDDAIEKLTTLINEIKEKKDNNAVLFVASIPDMNCKEYNGIANQCYWGYMTPTDRTQQTAYWNNYVKSYNTKLKDLVESYSDSDKIKYVDVNAVVDKDTMLVDGVHPNTAGYRAIANAFYTAIGTYYGVQKLEATSTTTPKDISGIPSDLTDGEKVGVPVTLNNDGTYTWSNLQTGYTENGFDYEWIYYVKEVTTSDKWEVTYTHNGQPAQGQMAITITNTGEEEAEKTSLSAKKEWKTNETGITSHPESVKLKLQQRSSSNVPWSDVSNSTVTVTENENWKHTWNDLEAGMYYKVVEVDTEFGWTVSYSENNCQQVNVLSESESPPMIIVTNTLDTGSLEINKLWLNDNAGDNTQVQVELYRQAYDANGEPVVEASAEQPSTVQSNRFTSGSGLVSMTRVKKALEENSAESEEIQLEMPIVMQNSIVNLFNTTVRAQSIDITGLESISYSHNSSDNVPELDLTDSTKPYYCGDKIISYIQVEYGDQWNTGSINVNGQIFINGGNGISSSSYAEDGVATFDTTQFENPLTKFSAWTYGSYIVEVRFYYTPTTPPTPTVTITQPDTTENVVGDTVLLTASSSSGKAIEWSSSNTNVATIDKLTGNILFVQSGSVTFTATDSSNDEATASIEFTVTPFKIIGNTSSSKNPEPIEEGTIKKLQANASSGVTWSSNNSDVISVDTNTGELTLKATSGTATITATRTFGNNQSVTDTIYYTIISKGIIIFAPYDFVHAGTEMQLTAELDGENITNQVDWKVVSGLATIDANGKMTVGDNVQENDTIQVKATRGTSEKTLDFTVKPLKISANAGNTTHLKLLKSIDSNELITLVNKIGTVKGNSDNSSVAYYDESSGRLMTGKTEGTANITLTDEGGGSVTIQVTVEIKKASDEQPDTATKLTGLTGMDNNGVITIYAKDNWQSNTISGLPKTDGNGNVYRYYIREITDSTTEARYIPVSYNVNGEPLGSDKLTLKVTNVARQTGFVELPESGGTGTKVCYTVGGILLLLSAAGYLTIKRRRWSIE